MPDSRLTETTAFAIIGKILSKNGSENWQTGQKLPPDLELCAEYGVSRTILREALRIIAAKGLIAAKPRDGTRITPPEQWALWDKDLLPLLPPQMTPQLHEMRRTIEPPLAQHAAAAATEPQKRELQAALRELQNAPNPATRLENETEFITALYAAANNPLAPVLRHLACHLISKRETPPPLAEYGALVAAISQGEATTAYTIAQNYLS